MFSSSTQAIPHPDGVPRHVAIIMDGNGRWAKQRFLPRVAGHRKGVDAVRAAVRHSIERGVGYLTLFAFSSENWRRPADEVSILMELFLRALEQEVAKLHDNGIRFRIAGDTSRFDARIRELIDGAESLTAGNTRLTLTIAANYGGRWDIARAAHAYYRAHPEALDGDVAPDAEKIAPFLSMSYAPEPDLFIRTGGEQRVSNFLLWQLAYAELYFTDLLWPDFDATAYDAAIASYAKRERRFGRTSEQLPAAAQVQAIDEMSALAKRVITAVAVLAFVFAAIYALPTRTFALVLLAVVLLAALEWAKLAGLAPGGRIALAAVVAALALAMLFIPALRFDGGWPPPLIFAICGAATAFWLVGATGWVIARWPTSHPALLAAIGVLVLVAFWMALVVLHARSPNTVVVAMALVWIADTMAFFAGRRFGRHKLAPQVSPGKTWEGVAGALAGVAIYAVACAIVVHRTGDAAAFNPRPATVAAWVAVAIVLAAMSIVGDLFESWMKRGAGVKDSGTLLPGHGGVLDRIDALLAAMPATALAVHEWVR